MAIAQMNWARLRYAPTDQRMAEFNSALSRIFAIAEAHEGFIWRIADADAVAELSALGHDERMSATVSVWQSIDDLHDYTFSSLHGEYLERKNEWFERVEAPQLVIWSIDAWKRPTFHQAFERLEHLKRNGDNAFAQGWPARLRA